jgi:hypothetical protein
MAKQIFFEEDNKKRQSKGKIFAFPLRGLRVRK